VRIQSVYLAAEPPASAARPSVPLMQHPHRSRCRRHARAARFRLARQVPVKECQRPLGRGRRRTTAVASWGSCPFSSSSPTSIVSAFQWPGHGCRRLCTSVRWPGAG
jgi:hypothetical protein